MMANSLNSCFKFIDAFCDSKRYPLRAEPPRIGHYRRVPPGDSPDSEKQSK